jgi:NadR type nicotinamide-nucleotide adenylyltransferase
MNPIRIVITGPECTGKTTLASRLAEYFGTVFIAEYAREYVENLGRQYCYRDVMHIAEKQLEQVKSSYGDNKIVIFDTWLIITKIWFEVVYGRYPLWIDDELNKGIIDLWLICSTDIPWFSDGVRENGGEKREELFNMYLSELKKIKGRYAIIEGTGDQRFFNALKAIKGYFPDLCS